MHKLGVDTHGCFRMRSIPRIYLFVAKAYEREPGLASLEPAVPPAPAAYSMIEKVTYQILDVVSTRRLRVATWATRGRGEGDGHGSQLRGQNADIAVKTRIITIRGGEGL